VTRPEKDAAADRLKNLLDNPPICGPGQPPSPS
jgi:hypothetical protein